MAGLRSTGLRLDGGPEFLRTLEQAGARIGDGLEDGARRTAALALGYVDEGMARHHRTGAGLRAYHGGPGGIAPGGIRVVRHRRGVYAELGARLLRLRLLERGTARQPADPLLYRALLRAGRQLTTTTGRAVSARLSGLRGHR